MNMVYDIDMLRNFYEFPQKSGHSHANVSVVAR